VHLLHRRQLRAKLLVLPFKHLHLFGVAFDHIIFFVQLSLENTRRRLQFDHLFAELGQFAFHHLEVVLGGVELLLLAGLLCLHFEAVRARLRRLEGLCRELVEDLVGEQKRLLLRCLLGVTVWERVVRVLWDGVRSVIWHDDEVATFLGDVVLRAVWAE